MIDQNHALPAGLSVVVPVYNSEGTLGALLARLEPILRATADEFEIILVNDSSRDHSWELVQKLSAVHPFVRGIDMMRNYGQHNALLCGIRAARFDVIATIDDDLQNPPEEIPRLMARLNEGFDVVYGTPEQLQHGVQRGLASYITKLAFQGAMGIDNATKASSFRVFRTQVREAFAGYSGPFVSIDVLLTYGTKRFSYLIVKHDTRTVGTSNYTMLKLIRHALNMITSFSMVPLQIATVLGFAMTGFGILILAYVLGRYMLSGQSVPGFPFLASMIAIFSGAQMFALGIIGEYLARMHLRSMGQPSYAIRQTCELPQAPAPEAT